LFFLWPTNVQNHRLVHPAVQEVFPDLVG
jgi:hypothetical protein